MPVTLTDNENGLKVATNMLSADFENAIRTFCMRWGVSPPLLRDKLDDLARDLLVSDFPELKLKPVSDEALSTVLGCSSCAVISHNTEFIAA